MPWRNSGLPPLVNGREGCLMNSIQYLNVSHMRSIRKIQQKRNDVRVRYVYEFRVEPQTDKILVVQVGEEPI